MEKITEALLDNPEMLIEKLNKNFDFLSNCNNTLLTNVKSIQEDIRKMLEDNVSNTELLNTNFKNVKLDFDNSNKVQKIISKRLANIETKLDAVLNKL